MASWKQAGTDKLKSGARGDAYDVQISAILEALNDDQVSDLLKDDGMNSFFDNNGIEKPCDKCDIMDAHPNWSDDVKKTFLEFFA